MQQRWEARWDRRAQRHKGGRVWTGLFLLIVGGLLLARQAGVLFPGWLFTWPVLLIGIGLWVGARHRFHGFGWIIPIGIGVLNLLGEFNDFTFVRPYIGPAVLIFLGLVFILKPRRNRFPEEGAGPFASAPVAEADASAPVLPGSAEPLGATERIDITAVFGGVKKNVLSKEFRGGEIVTFMGGAEINLTQADFSQPVRIDCTNVFGGTKLIIPPDWEVQSDIVAVFGGVDDKRPPATSPAPHKRILLDGTCVFGGVEIRSF